MPITPSILLNILNRSGIAATSPISRNLITLKNGPGFSRYGCDIVPLDQDYSELDPNKLFTKQVIPVVFLTVGALQQALNDYSLLPALRKNIYGDHGVNEAIDKFLGTRLSCREFGLGEGTENAERMLTRMPRAGECTEDSLIWLNGKKIESFLSQSQKEFQHNRL